MDRAKKHEEQQTKSLNQSTINQVYRFIDLDQSTINQSKYKSFRPAWYLAKILNKRT